jgi:BASS family bile acid:Na+ symporter
MNIKGLLSSGAFMMSLALIVSLITNFGGFFPGDVLTADVRANLTVLTLALMLTISLSRIPMTDLNPVKHWRSMARSVVLGLVVSSIIPIIGYYVLKGLDIENMEYYATGLVFIAATPFAASVMPLSIIQGGDAQHAARGTIIVYLAALLWIPFIIWVTLRDYVDMGGGVITVLEIIAAPLILSRLLTRFKISKEHLAIFLNICIFILVWMSVASTSFPSSMGILLAFAFIAALRSFGLGNALEVTERRMGIPWAQRVTDILMSSYKNKGIAITLCVALMGPNTPLAMVAIATSIIIEISWVIFMDAVLFSEKRRLRVEGTDSA